MALTSTTVQERRRFIRRGGLRCSVDLLQSRRPVAHRARHSAATSMVAAPPVTAESVNVSEGGLCIRLDQMLEVRSLVQLQLTPARPPGPPGTKAGAGGDDLGRAGDRKARPMHCQGRVTWVMQRLDLRDMPPLLFDTGIEFVNPSPSLRQFLIRQGIELMATKKASTRQKRLEPSVIRGRTFVPRLERPVTRPSRWHLVVSVDGMACFSEHFPSERTAVTAWTTFKRRQAKR